MPLFASKHNKNNKAENTSPIDDHHRTVPHTGTGAQGYSTTGGSAADPMRAHPGGSALGYNNTNTGPTNTFGPDHCGTQQSGAIDSTHATGLPGLGFGGTTGIPPTSTVSHGPGSGNGGGSGQRMAGKVESAVGSLVGSAALKEKGARKEQEANTIKMQGSELAEAERLEAEALMRRERAVAHGAHPANAALGGGNMGQGGYN